ncbi:hypothetical protein CC85DRAFT_125488 [Cutaneotrichosporon oleaginosum]|uniref:Uncharacterized protein n=1 Tax=Cutaneotrichosporon oleaginosum TaxID=879819 RepID=A0A0J1B0R9_9TREE|nr:uncharacterized protein CC85DRAFT_125488 [Cutaneotrichosporon oleaginosum]KLT41204.1 hypothetical protein CC85DRAFT_125488 [Cutaneotrichosporon oleaginosum]TXT05470.1 hypothetical protein COLE_06790 [Cutaneotrichosporon oleaginosum]
MYPYQVSDIPRHISTCLWVSLRVAKGQHALGPTQALLSYCISSDPSLRTVCSSPVVGYSAPPLVHVGGLGFLPCLSGALLVNPLAASFSGIAMLTLLAAWALDISGLRPAVLATLVLATFSSVLAFALNLAFILVNVIIAELISGYARQGQVGN